MRFFVGFFSYGALFNKPNPTQITSASLRPGAQRLLQLLDRHSVQKNIVSAEDVSNAKYLAQLRIAHHFEKMRFGVRNKEDAIREILNEYKVDPHNAFYLGDTADGLLQAKRAGVTTLGFLERRDDPSHIQKDANPYKTVLSFMEVIHICRSHLM